MKTLNFDYSKVKELLSYDPESGNFYWINNSGRHGRISAGSIAGTKSKAHGYIEIHIRGVLLKAHRVAWFFMTGALPEQQIDHINGKRHDNRFCNLRACSGKDNMENKKTYKSNASGFPGVTWHKRIGRWQARIGAKGVRHHLGYWDNEQDAANAYATAKLEKHKFNPNIREKI